MTALIIICCCIGLGVGCLLSRLGWSEPPEVKR